MSRWTLVVQYTRPPHTSLLHHECRGPRRGRNDGSLSPLRSSRRNDSSLPGLSLADYKMPACIAIGEPLGTSLLDLEKLGGCDWRKGEETYYVSAETLMVRDST